jgi:hypothetical protein
MKRPAKSGNACVAYDATFVHYTDGRWVLNKVQGVFLMGLASRPILRLGSCG